MPDNPDTDSSDDTDRWARAEAGLGLARLRLRRALRDVEDAEYQMRELMQLLIPARPHQPSQEERS